RKDFASAFRPDLKAGFDRRARVAALLWPFGENMAALAHTGSRQEGAADRALTVKNAAPFARIQIERAANLVAPDISDFERHLDIVIPDLDCQAAQVMRLSDARILAFRTDAQSQLGAITDIVRGDEPVLHLKAASVALP